MATIIGEGLTYSDVLLVPKKSQLRSRSEADTTTQITRRISLNIPLVASNMASVTEAKMAIALARAGGVGILHQFCSVEEQVAQVHAVKKSTSYVVHHPVTIAPEVTLHDAVAHMNASGVTSLLVIDDGDLIGILTSRDYTLEQDWSKAVAQVMTPRQDLITAPASIGLDNAKELLHKHRIEKLPLLSEEGHLAGLITTQDIKKLEQWKHASRDSRGRLLVGAAVGVKDTVKRAHTLVGAGCDFIVLDVAHAHSDHVISCLRTLKSTVGVDVLVGNVATAQAARDLIAAGADGLKVGIGPSPVCTTRIISGSGMPQLTAIMTVAAASSVPICADGGISYPGDVTKALAAGASTVMVGSILAGTDEAPGMIINKNGRRYKRYYGSASYDSNHERKEKEKGEKLTTKLNVFVEGVSKLVEYKGPVTDTLEMYVKGLRSGISYGGARNIRELQEKAEFIRISSQGWQESLDRHHSTIPL